ncbi:leukocyte-associated immunoglobulin-like receptor 1 isoform X2 [Lepus europaeus]|uniref:leukocyte-associated immunoglobulin-like receptor 1 isoform X2 n=1 Tax=Lepus europaeus TaxID=9983 RepID=UPI002B4618E9|nr:leukocyte-associated immunoglobulin-like receptor 1 isoform X2 [Lepus europaeus]
MSPDPTILLCLGLCLGQVIHVQVQAEAWPTPSISTEPGPPFLPGQPVTIVCRSPVGFDTFRLEKEGREFKNERSAPPNQTEAQFPFVTVDGNTGRYNCVYYKSGTWSERSGPLELVVTPEDVPRTSDPDPASAVPSGRRTGVLYILVGVSAAFLLCLLLLVLLCLHHQSRKKHGAPSSKGEGQETQERLSLDTDPDRTPDKAAADRLAGQDGKRDAASPAAGGPQDVTYAQLDHRAMARRAAGAVSPQPAEPTAESSTYAALARR